MKTKQRQRRQQPPAVIEMMILSTTLAIIKMNLIMLTFVNHVSKESMAMDLFSTRSQ
ncbi:MAG TPA: hypothetical protein VE226_04525 [Nitrososphaeraceae archaeon]|nr:hypothetical protein [Nitrososphaeraceae archaeon]